MGFGSGVIAQLLEKISGNAGDGSNPKKVQLSPQYAASDTQFKKGGKVKSASARADGIAIRGKTRA